MLAFYLLLGNDEDDDRIYQFISSYLYIVKVINLLIGLDQIYAIIIVFFLYSFVII